MKELTLTQRILDFFSDGSPLSWSETKQQLYGLPIRQKRIRASELFKSIEKVKRQGWLDKKVKNDEIYYSLTRQGRIKFLLFKARTQRKERGKQATIIIFDIPEEKRTFRNFLRRLLTQMKFTMIQRSVFITPYILPKEFFALLREMDLMQYVKVIEGEIRYH